MIKNKNREFSLKLWILSCLFGIGSWVVMNGIWVELPNLVNQSPEGWKLPSYMTVIVQIANIGPILYCMLRNKCCIGHQPRLQHFTILFILFAGIIGCCLLSGLWKETSFIFGSERSVALLSLTFVISLVDCTSSVTFLPFMSQLPSLYMSPFYIGENLSSLVTALVGLGQGVDVYNGTANDAGGHQTIISEARFDQSVFFMILAFVLFLSFGSYIFLKGRNSSALIVTRVDETEKRLIITRTLIITETTTESSSSSEDEPSTPLLGAEHRKQNDASLTMYFLCVFWLSLLQNGVIASIGSFAYAPYGELSYHLASTLGPIAGSLACFVFMFHPRTSKFDVVVGSICYSITSVYLIVVATMSPHPLGYDDESGKIVIVIVCILSASFVSYTKLAIASVMRIYGHRYLFYLGVVMQLGSFCGAIVMFPIVNYTNSFST